MVDGDGPDEDEDTSLSPAVFSVCAALHLSSESSSQQPVQALPRDEIDNADDHRRGTYYQPH
jgi:hypothetical protein